MYYMILPITCNKVDMAQDKSHFDIRRVCIFHAIMLLTLNVMIF